MAFDLKSIKSLQFPDSQYYRKEHRKKQIVFHHTASGIGIEGDYSHWLDNPYRIATCVIVARDGQIYQLFSSKYWAHHLGVKVKVFKDHDIGLEYRKNSQGQWYTANNEILNEQSIGVEIDSWGPLYESNGRFYSWAGTQVKKENVCEYKHGWREYPFCRFFHDKGIVGKKARYYEKYTDEQIQACKDLVKFWRDRYSIPISYNDKMWDVSPWALRGKPGIWTHASYRENKQDCHPQEEFLLMLKSLV